MIHILTPCFHEILVAAHIFLTGTTVNLLEVSRMNSLLSISKKNENLKSHIAKEYRHATQINKPYLSYAFMIDVISHHDWY